MKRIVFVLVLLAVLFSFVAPLSRRAARMVCRAWGGCDYTDVNGVVQHVGYGQTAWYYRALAKASSTSNLRLHRRRAGAHRSIRRAG